MLKLTVLRDYVAEQTASIKTVQIKRYPPHQGSVHFFGMWPQDFFYLTLLVNKETSDTPYALALAALESIPTLTNTENTGFAWTLYTGDLVSHDPDNQLSRFVLTPSSTTEERSSLLFTGVTLNMLRYSVFKLHLIINLSSLLTFNRLYCMTFSNRCSDLALFILLLEIMIVTISPL